MEVILGPFHPFLEDALVEEVLRHKNEAPLSPILILVPSDSLRRRLKVLLARERGLNLLNLHLLTFYQLSLRLWEERHGAETPPLTDNSLLEEILRQIIRKRLPGAEAFAGLEEQAGGAAALWQTLRDLKDGTVDPAIALEAARGNLFEEATEGVEKLLVLFQTFLSCCEQWNLQDYADLDVVALEQAPASIYLKRFERILYYGFYDLTQVQLDLFQTVARHYPTTLFFPLVQDRPKHPAWTFAERFYERYALGLAGAGSQIRNLMPTGNGAARASLLPLFAEAGDQPRQAQLDNFPVAVLSCFSGRDEIDTAAKEILRLVDDEKYSWNEIGVVGRTLDPYLPWIKEIFSRHSIPIVTSAEEPLIQHPLAKAALLLVNLPLKGYLRSHVIDLLDSPFFNSASSGAERITPRPDLWDFATRRLGIGKGIDEWRRLEKHLAQEVASTESPDEDGEPRPIRVPAEQIQTLWHLVTEIFGALETLPKEASWSRYVTLWRTLQTKWLSVDSAEGASARAAAESIGATLDRLSALDAVGEKISLSHFLETYEHWLERASIAFTDRNAHGVAVLDAMAARGISFRALFIVGLNEGLFPRTIREDAFLRDRERALFETVLGYKVATKLGGFDEERLLFTLLVGSAKERLYALYGRNDGGGRPLAPSWYLDELGRAVGGAKIKKVIIPRRAVEKSLIEPFTRPELLPAEELAIQLIVTSKDPMPLVNLCLPTVSLYKRGSEAAGRLESIADALAERDGIVGPIGDYWKRIAEEGLSPTSLEVYARCPFQFFARHLLGLERLERPEEFAGPAAADEGQIVHAILRAFYRDLIDRGFFANKKSVDSNMLLKAVTEKVFREFAQNNPVGYPLAWEILQEDIAALLEQAVARDLAELSESGYRPVALECDAVVRLPENWPKPLSGIMIRGRMDRIDYQPAENRYRVVDYKLKFGKSRHPADKDLFRSALRGLRLQPPFYLLLGKPQAEARNRAAASIDAAFYFLAPQWPEGPLAVESLPGNAWDGASGAALKETVAFLAESIRRGLFFIQPGDYCRYCEVAEICRKNHPPTRWRVERDSRCNAHLELKQKTLDDDDDGHDSVA